jgi:hypothetical protein
MTRVVAPRHNLFMRLVHAAAHLVEHTDHVAYTHLHPAHLILTVTFSALATLHHH